MTSLQISNLRMGLTSALALLLPAAPAGAIELTMSMNNTTYFPGQAMEIAVTAHNHDPADVTLWFPSSCQMYYQMGPYRVPQICFYVITHVTVPAFGSYTWTMQHSWSAYNPGLGTHSVTGEIEGYGVAGTLFFEVIEPVPPTKSFLVDFDHLPDTDIPLGRVQELWPYGLRFRSIDSDPPGIVSYGGNQYLTIGRCTYPTGFNIVAEFDMPVYGLTAHVNAGGGNSVTLIARAADGTELDRAMAASTAYMDFSAFVSVQSTTAIASAEWWPGITKASVSVDDLYLFLVPVRADLNGDGHVDQADLDHFEACHTGPHVHQADPACLDARLDDDQDVDQSDFGILQRCLSGSLPVDANCAN